MEGDIVKKVLQKILNPNKFIGIPLCICSIILLVVVFSLHLEESVIAYISYLLSAYSLIIFMIWFCKACKFSSDFIKETDIYKNYEKYRYSILKITLILSSIINFIYGIFKLVTGIYYKSWWFITFATYYLILWSMKASLVKNTEHFGENINKEYKKLKNTGIILLFLNIILTGMVVLILKKGQYFSYPGYLIYIVALYDFYLTITAFINVFKHISYKSPAVSASKCISLTVAMISMLSLEVAMIYQFGNDDMNFKKVMISCTGFGIILINTGMAILMIDKGNKKS